MKTITVTDFKAHALQVINRISQTKEPITLTKRGIPIATVLPYTPAHEKPVPGLLSEQLDFEKDIISPLGEEIWDSAK